MKTLFRLLLLLPLMSLAPQAMAQDSLRIAAVVNDDVISLLDVAVRTRIVIISSGLQDTPETRSRLMPQVLRGLIDEHLKLQEAKRLGITVSQVEIDRRLNQLAEQNKMTLDQFEKVLSRNGILIDTMADQFRAEISWAKLVQRRLRPTITIGDDEIDEALAKIKENLGKPEYRVSEIFLAVDNPGQEDQVRQAAERLIEQIRQGADFGNVARQFSQSASSTGGGDLGWIHPGQLENALDDAIAGMQPGDIAGPIRSTGGFHVLQLRDRRETSASQAANGVVSLKQLFLPIPAGATPDEEAAVVKRAQEAVADAKSCDAMARIARELNPKANVDLDNVSIGDLPPALQPAAATLPIGQTSEPLRIQTGIGIYMICQRDMGQNGLPPRSEIADQLIRERLDVLARGYLRDLRRAAFVDMRV